MNIIKILGGGCANCNTLEAMAREICNESNIEAEFVKVKEYQDILGYGVMATPGLVLNEKVIHSGKLPTKDRLKRLMTEELNK
ncbi:MAG TPA: thioredoxin family protein [Melioribacteraceae bacterium]|nr:thioredoxin family protein [Melioribacteraceae bacterium]